MLKARYEMGRFLPYALLGLRMDYQLSYESDLNYDLIKNDFNKTIFGMSFGAGVEYKIKQLGIFVEGQYHWDFTKVMDTPSTSTNAGIEIYNKALIINAGVKYYLKKKDVVR